MTVTHSSLSCIYLFIYFLFLNLHVSSTSCSSSGETNCVNITSGNCHSVGDHVVCRTLTRHGHQYRVTVTRGCIDTFSLSWWWAQCARNMWRVKNKNKHMIKKCASCWSFTKNHNTMHSQQTVKLCLVVYVNYFKQLHFFDGVCLLKVYDGMGTF
jgi:hypothetical protein